MTANRALSELTAERVLRRVRGAGTFVAAPPRGSTLVEIRSIADEIRERGHAHRARVLSLARRPPPPPVAAELGLAPGEPAFRSRIVHLEDHLPVQLEDRWVSAEVAPGYGAQDFAAVTPNEYLTRVAPLSRVEYRVEARLAPAAVRGALELGAREPCLLLHRRTWSAARVASVADLWHPGRRWRFTGHF
jgi:GntR family histidine utilization transcriptional repressor